MNRYTSGAGKYKTGIINCSNSISGAVIIVRYGSRHFRFGFILGRLFLFPPGQPSGNKTEKEGDQQNNGPGRLSAPE